MRMYEIIHKKRNGLELKKEEIEFFIDGYVKGDIPDYQASALIMAIYFQGMTDEETAYLTDAMANSGDTVDLSMFGDLSVDKHSTGGVGDKTTLVIAPIVASLGGKVAKMSGRGLGHTGGTIDKLESIEGFRVEMENEEFMKQVEDIGIAVIGQSGELAPADKMLYALRDVTATVESPALIASSVMSKKIASGAKSIVLDITCGNGAFMKNEMEAFELAGIMQRIGTSCGRRVATVVSDMSVPLGHAVGNSLEVKEAIEVLNGFGPEDLSHVCLVLAARMILLVKGCKYEEALKMVTEAVDNGSALRKFKEWIAAQGGNIEWIDNPGLFPVAKKIHDIKSLQEGYISEMDTEQIGLISVALGAGREKKGDPIDYTAGLYIHKKTGDYVEKGETIATLYTNREGAVKSCEEKYQRAIKMSMNKPEEKRVIIGYNKK